MIDKNTLEKRRTEYAEELHAGSVYRDILAREKERPIYEKRWFWELLQNAKDSVAVDNNVNVKIEINDNEVSFSHTGNSFKVDEILSLIIQGSSKTDDDSKTGRFGTGFMTTYLLSKKVKIAGQLEAAGGFFEFDLNRDVNDSKDNNAIKEFFRLQQESNDKFISSIREASYLGEGNFQTRFIYNLDDKGKITSEKGLKSLNELIPFTQIFNSQIGTITVVKDGNPVTYEKSKLNSYEVESNKVEEWVLKSSDSDSELKAYLIREEEFDVVCVTEKKEGVEYLKNLNSQYPKLFFTFPLIGTEELGIPFIINSTLFDPKIERDGIYLKSDGNESNGINKNKELITKSLEIAIAVYPEIIKKNNIRSHFNIFDFSKSKGYSWIDDDWFTKLKISLIDKITEEEFIHLGDFYYKYNGLDIPYSPDEKLLEDVWKLVNESKSYNAIPYAEQSDWIRIAENFASMKNKDVFEESNIIGSKELKNYVSIEAKLTSLKDDLEVHVYDWLDRLYQFIIDDLGEFTLKKKILLNQENDFVEAEKLSWDEIKDEVLITISNKIDLNFSKELISKDIKIFEITGVEAYKKDSAIENLKNKLNQLKDSDYATQEKLEANATFLKWLIDNSKNEIIKDLKILSFDKKEESNLISRVFPSGKHLILPPKDFFKKGFPKYSEIIRDKDCMHHSYTNSLGSSDYESLDKWGFIHYSPLVKRKEKLDPKTIDLLIQNSNDLTPLKDDDGKLTVEIELEYSDFAYLTTSEGHIYDRNSTTSSSLKIFDFLLNEASEKDEYFNFGGETITVGDNQIVFDKTLWLKRAKNIQWVNVKDIESEGTNKFVKEVPSSKNLSELIKDNDDLVKTIRGEKQITFLSKIKVGVSDLIRNTLKTDEIRISWDKALTTMITSGVSPELAQEIFSDPVIQNEYKKRLDDKKLINRNQQLGAIVEELFRELILKLKEQGVNIDIIRKPFGSDYLLSDESSDLVNNNKQEEIFNINDWLIELKATGKNYAAMTSLQATTAADKKDNYALVVVPLDGSDLNIEYVRTHAKVVGNIGYKLVPVVGEFNDIESHKNELITGHDGVSVNIEDHNVRFRVDSTVWNSEEGISISEFIETHFKE
ncbi:hypothetical protein SAMN05444274_1262 [Mariniphaga anaerophila]|uniref:Histidine kinase-, DNA gyrase B-, and HSP90-like ATPase n=1 Tax=Mariniphaga anaerophila TaxID=1484053 RepID=A0A1M5GLF8_9BACT|nr:hypothetical protein [Mariniphaga anaerophila]SHG04523.1 hypothetical protein SAMN05444274_1262 [Mariniphaga anaerophila]